MRRFRVQRIQEDGDEPGFLIVKHPKAPWTCEFCHLKHEGDTLACNYCGRTRSDHEDR